MKDLDWEAAKTAQEILKGIGRNEKAAREADDLTTKTLAVLQEHGPYAAALFLCSKIEEKGGTSELVLGNLFELAKTLGVTDLTVGRDVERTLDSVIKQICSDAKRLVLVKQAWEQALIYARYSAKSLKAQVRAQSHVERS